MRRVSGAVSAVLIAAGLVLTGTAASASGMPPCPTEDSTSCHWDATLQGNGSGVSFTTYPHHGPITGDLNLNRREVRRIERRVHHLHVCHKRQVSNCKEFIGHRRSIASFERGRWTYYAELTRGRLTHVERYL